MLSHLEMLLFEITCQTPKCGKSFHEPIGYLCGKDAVRCSRCGASIDLKSYKGAIDHFADTASELDIIARGGK